MVLREGCSVLLNLTYVFFFKNSYKLCSYVRQEYVMQYLLVFVHTILQFIYYYYYFL